MLLSIFFPVDGDFYNMGELMKIFISFDILNSIENFVKDFTK